MARNRQDGRNGQPNGVGAAREVARLRQRFAIFRRAQRSRTRIPDALREAVITALERGVTEKMVRRACGITADQIAQWRLHRVSGAKRSDVAEQAARVFPVIDETPEIQACGAGGHQEQQLELRIGKWTISIGQMGV